MRFFVLQNPKSDEQTAATEFVPVDNSPTGQAPRCPRCGRYVDMLPLLPPVRVELDTWGPEFGDMAFGPSNELLVSDRFWRLYGASNLAGMIYVGSVQVTKVKSHRKLMATTPDYHCCRAGISKATIDDSESGLEREGPAPCPECRIGGVIKRTKKIALESNSWSGEDIFVARGLPGTILASESFETFCRENAFSNCKLVPAESFSFDYYT